MQCYTDSEPLDVCVKDTVQWQAEGYNIKVVFPNRQDHNAALFLDSNATARWMYRGDEVAPQAAKDATVDAGADIAPYEYTVILTDPITGDTYKYDPGMKAGGQMQKCEEVLCHSKDKDVERQCLNEISNILKKLDLLP